MLIQEEVHQAKRLLKEFDVDCWITFLRESQINGDPTLAFLLGEAVTWHSAFVVTQSGRTQALVGLYDKIMVEDVGVYDEFPHGLGHQAGRYVHDGTALMRPAWEKYAEKPFQKLESSMVFTIEPRLAVPGRGVATIEEMVVVTEDGADYLTEPQKELVLID